MNQAGATEGLQHVPPCCRGNRSFSTNPRAAGGGRGCFRTQIRILLISSISHYCGIPCDASLLLRGIVLVSLTAFSDSDGMPHRELPSNFRALRIRLILHHLKILQLFPNLLIFETCKNSKESGPTFLLLTND